jgi:hypothetical protein
MLRDISEDDLKQFLNDMETYQSGWGVVWGGDDASLDKSEMFKILVRAFLEVKPLLEKYRPKPRPEVKTNGGR